MDGQNKAKKTELKTAILSSINPGLEFRFVISSLANSGVVVMFVGQARAQVTTLAGMYGQNDFLKVLQKCHLGKFSPNCFLLPHDFLCNFRI